jgi:hypothetical protein
MQKSCFSGLKLDNGEPIYTQEYIQSLRDKDKKHPDRLKIIAQRGGQERMLSIDADIKIVGGSRGGPLDENTMVLTSKGFVKIKELKYGDTAIGSDGKGHRVLGLLAYPKRDCYEITLSDGAKITCSDDHIWNVYIDGNRRCMPHLACEIEKYITDGYDITIPCVKPVEFDESYGLASISERMSTLERLISNTGRKSGEYWCKKYRTSKQATDFKYLVDSLGSVCYVRETAKKKWSVRFNYKKKELVRRIVSCKKIGKRDCCCIAVDNPDALFVVEDFIVTHNSKSFSSLMEVLKDIKNPDFHATILRNEKDDLQSLVTDSYKLFSQFGTYNKSQNDMTWNFTNGGWLKFSYYAGSYQDFKTRFQGRQFAYVCIDEGTQCPYKKFKYLLTNNRNASQIRNRFWITCNPDPESWVRKFIDWWVDEDGYIIPERDGVIRYCFMDGDTPDSIYWGDTREEVYEQCGGIIDKLWKESYAELGYTKLEMFIKSATFIRADVSENIKLISTDASYLANLAQQDEEQRMRDLEANWNWKSAGDDMIKMADLEEIFDNAVQVGDGVRRASADIAFTGGDNFVMWLWEGWHCKDLVVMRLDSQTLVSAVQAKLREWGVEECNFTYDLQGIGQYFKGFFADAVPFNNQAAPVAMTHQEEKGIKFLYKDLKSQCAFLFYKMIKEKQISIESSLLERKYSGDGFDKVPLRQILQKERKMLRRDDNSDDRGFKLLPKKIAKRYVGHSPDFFESWLYIMIFSLTKKKHKKIKGLWML